MAIYVAKGKNIRQSSQKVSLVADLIRGRSLMEAKRILKFSNKKAAGLILKVLESASANAKSLGSVDEQSLKVSHITADQGPTYKRVRFGARGRVKPILKRTSHITVKLEEVRASGGESQKKDKSEEADNRTKKDKASASKAKPVLAKRTRSNPKAK